MKIKYHILCPNCKDMIVQEKAHPAKLDKDRYTFSCDHCGCTFDLLRDNDLMNLQTSINSLMHLTVVWIYMIFLKILMLLQIWWLLIPILWLLFLVVLAARNMLPPVVLQHIHNNLQTKWGQKKEMIFGATKWINIMCGLLFFSFLFFIIFLFL